MLDAAATGVLMMLLWGVLAILCAILTFLVVDGIVTHVRRRALEAEARAAEMPAVTRDATDVGYAPDVDARRWQPGRAPYLRGAARRAESARIREVIHGALDQRQRDDAKTELIHAPQIVDARPIPYRRRLVTVVDELGEWVPSVHELAQPLLLGDVIMRGTWATITPQIAGLVAV